MDKDPKQKTPIDAQETKENTPMARQSKASQAPEKTSRETGSSQKDISTTAPETITKKLNNPQDELLADDFTAPSLEKALSKSLIPQEAKIALAIAGGIILLIAVGLYLGSAYYTGNEVRDHITAQVTKLPGATMRWKEGIMSSQGLATFATPKGSINVIVHAHHSMSFTDQGGISPFRLRAQTRITGKTNKEIRKFLTRTPKVEGSYIASLDSEGMGTLKIHPIRTRKKKKSQLSIAQPIVINATVQDNQHLSSLEINIPSFTAKNLSNIKYVNFKDLTTKWNLDTSAANSNIDASTTLSSFTLKTKKSPKKKATNIKAKDTSFEMDLDNLAGDLSDQMKLTNENTNLINMFLTKKLKASIKFATSLKGGQLKSDAKLSFSKKPKSIAPKDVLAVLSAKANLSADKKAIKRIDPKLVTDLDALAKQKFIKKGKNDYSTQISVSKGKLKAHKKKVVLNDLMK